MAVYVVWSPQLGAEEKHVPGATRLIPDPRVSHYWDPEARVGMPYTPVFGEVLGPAYADLSGSGVAAWDVWMLFDGDARWDDGGPPVPTWWEHQLGMLPDEFRLDPARFAGKAAALGSDGPIP